MYVCRDMIYQFITVIITTHYKHKEEIGNIYGNRVTRMQEQLERKEGRVFTSFHFTHTFIHSFRWFSLNVGGNSSSSIFTTTTTTTSSSSTYSSSINNRCKCSSRNNFEVRARNFRRFWMMMFPPLVGDECEFRPPRRRRLLVEDEEEL